MKSQAKTSLLVMKGAIYSAHYINEYTICNEKLARLFYSLETEIENLISDIDSQIEGKEVKK